mgnify:FL=1
MNSLYANPKYYEIAFSYRDIPQEVRTMQEIIRRFSLVPVKSVLEFGCGNSPHMEELMNHGYSYVGLDLSREMLNYSQSKAKKLGGHAKFVWADMVDFELEQPVDFAYTMLGSLYVKNTKQLLSHFECAHANLMPGGLYLLDWCVDFTCLADTQDAWLVEQDDIAIYVRYHTRSLNFIEQTVDETIELTIDDNGTTRRLTHNNIRRAIYPQEFLLISHKVGFEFIGWWNNWDLTAPLTGKETEVNRAIAVLRAR